MREDGLLYLAYGLDMNQQRMRAIVPTAELLRDAMLKDYKLVFRGNRSGWPTIEYEPGSAVPAMLWRIRPEDESVLDAEMGVPHLRHKQILAVDLEGKPRGALTYILNYGYPLNHPLGIHYSMMIEGYKNAGLDANILRAFARKIRKEVRL